MNATLRPSHSGMTTSARRACDSIGRGEGLVSMEFHAALTTERCYPRAR